MISDSADDDFSAVYNQKLLRLSQKADVPVHLTAPDVSAHAVSPICGSEVMVELKLSQGSVTAFGFDVDACALTKTAVAVMADAIIGKSRADIQKAANDMRAMLDGTGPGPDGDWAEMRILLPVKDYKARHNAMMLPFEAVERAFSSKT